MPVDLTDVEWAANQARVHAFRPNKSGRGWRSLCCVKMSDVRTVGGAQYVVAPQWSVRVTDVGAQELARRWHAGSRPMCARCVEIVDKALAERIS